MSSILSDQSFRRLSSERKPRYPSVAEHEERGDVSIPFQHLPKSGGRRKDAQKGIVNEHRSIVFISVVAIKTSLIHCLLGH